MGRGGWGGGAGRAGGALIAFQQRLATPPGNARGPATASAPSSAPARRAQHAPSSPNHPHHDTSSPWCRPPPCPWLLLNASPGEGPNATAAGLGAATGPALLTAPARQGQAQTSRYWLVGGLLPAPGREFRELAAAQQLPQAAYESVRWRQRCVACMHTRACLRIRVCASVGARVSLREGNRPTGM